MKPVLRQTWHHLFSEGHHYYKNDRGDIAIADWSMRICDEPASQDDGLILLDLSREIGFSTYRASALIPVQGEFHSTPGSVREMVLLCKELGMKVRIEDVVFTVDKT